MQIELAYKQSQTSGFFAFSIFFHLLINIPVTIISSPGLTVSTSVDWWIK